jgi:Flp pilus assembly pilin Flp
MHLIKKFTRKLERQTGQAMVEYVLLLSLIALSAVGALRGIGQSVNRKLQQVNENLQ